MGARPQTTPSTQDLEAQFRAIFDLTREGILVADDAGRYVEANAAACTLFGMKRERIIGKSVEDFADPQRREEVRKSWTQFLEQGTQSGLFRIFRPDGTTRHVDYTARAHVLPQWNITMLHDITERDQAERSLRDNEDRLRRALIAAQSATRAKTQFFANISHEIRTPINGILGTLELLRRTALLPDQKEYVAMMEDSGRTLMALVQDLLDFSRADAGKLKLDLKGFDLISALQRQMAVLQVRARAKRLELEWDIQEDLPRRIQGDSIRLRQVISNLIGNAIKFTARGKVMLRVTKKEKGRGRDTLRFTVTDSGPGIPAHQKKLLFKPFSQGDASASRGHAGSGLGLAISKQLVELMGGKIGFRSIPGRGSTFWFWVPLRPFSGDARLDSRSSVSDNDGMIGVFPKSRILVVEDNQINRIVTVRLLEQLGYAHVDTATDGFEALRILKRKRYDVILMDCQMPKLDGYETTARIRRREHDGRIPIIAMTAHATMEDRHKCLEAGMDDYVSKPVQTTTLQRMLARWLSPNPSAKRKPMLSPRSGDPVDLSQLGQVVKNGNPSEDPLIQNYFRDTATKFGRIDRFIQRQSRERVQELAHYTLGASRMLGMTRVADQVRQIEVAGAHGTWPEAMSALHKAKAQLALAQTYLKHRSLEAAC